MLGRYFQWTYVSVSLTISFACTVTWDTCMSVYGDASEQKTLHFILTGGVEPSIQTDCGVGGGEILLQRTQWLGTGQQGQPYRSITESQDSPMGRAALACSLSSHSILVWPTVGSCCRWWSNRRLFHSPPDLYFILCNPIVRVCLLVQTSRQEYKQKMSQ